MRLRDVLIVLVALVATLFGWIQEGSLVINNSFFVAVTDSDAQVHQMPPPVITDLNGDGSPETLLLVTRDHLAVYPTGALRRSYDNSFVPLSHTFVAALGSPAIGIATGHLTYPDNKSFVTSGPKRRRQHVAVVTDDYRLTLFNYRLEEVWSVALLTVSEASMIPYHASIQLLPERIYEQDLGCVIVSVVVGGPNATERMAFFGINGASGEIRWKRTIDTFDALDKAVASRQLHPERIDRLIFSESDLFEHNNELDWHHFRESVVAAMPHSYSHPWDDQIHPHHFFKVKGRKKHDRKEAVLSGKAVGGAPAGAAGASKYKSRHVSEQGNDVGELGEHLHMLRKGIDDAVSGKGGKPHERRRLHPNVIVHHSRVGIQVLHLYTGKPVTRLMPLKRHVTYHDVDDDFSIDEVGVDIGARQTHHHRHGMDEEIVCNGVVWSGIPYSEHPTFNVTICDSEGLMSSMSLLTHFIRGDGAEDEPRADPLSLIGSRNVGHKYTRAVTPLVVQQHSAKGVNMWRVRRRAVFMIDSGLVTCVSPVSKQVIWRAQTDAGFENKKEAEEVSGGLHSQEEADNRVRRFPHLSHYSFHAADAPVRSAKTMHYGSDPYVIAVGTRVMAAVNARNGHIIRSAKLYSPPIAPLVVADFNGDGTNDIVVTSENGYYGFIVTHQNGGSTTSILMAMTIALLALLYGAQRAMRDHDEDEETMGLGGLGSAAGADDDESAAGEFKFGRSGPKHRVPVAKRSTD